MRITRLRSMVLYFIILLFSIGLIFFVYEFSLKSKEWAFSSVNRHLSQGTVSQGKILDKSGIVLAETENKKRKYNEDEKIRKALLHTVGDGCIFIPTSIQSLYKSELFGYNFVTGFGAPNLLGFSQDLTLTLDSKICSKVSESFKGKKGTALAYNYLNGEIICMVSLPTYDVMNRPLIKSEDKYEGIYLNRAVSSSYTPGSVLKIFTTLAALDLIEDSDKKTFTCNKVKTVDGEKIVCMKNHGKITLKDALCKSCDIAFADIALELGKEKMTEKMNEFGFNNKLKFDKLDLKISEYNVENASLGGLGWSGIGQYTDKLNPMHMLKIMGALANDGICVEPYIVKSSKMNSYFSETKYKSPGLTKFINSVSANKVKEMMRYTMKNGYGDAMFSGFPMCAKTGTAEVGSNKKPHGWMVGFSYDKSFPVAFVVIVENGDFGIRSAGPIASEMVKNIYNKFKNDKII